MHNRLGRIATEPDPRNWLIREIRPKKASKKTHQYWNDLPVFLDQGNTPTCVGHAWTHWVLDGPVKHKGLKIDPFEVYHIAQDEDEIPGTGYDGSTTLGGVKAIQKMGMIKEYRFAETMDDIFYALLEFGPGVCGTRWDNNMFNTDKKGRVKLGGGEAGGHEYLLNGINMKTKMIRIKNSWGKYWGVKGRAWISFDDFADLFYNNGDFCIALEK